MNRAPIRRNRRYLAREMIALCMFLLVLLPSRRAHAYIHMVTQGETLAQIALRVYGNPKLETVLVGANSLDAKGGSVIVPGMRLEILAPGHYRVEAGESWAQLALRFLGSDKRAETLAKANQGVSWVPPTEGQEIEIPAGRFACLRYTRTDEDGVATFWFATSAPGMPLKFEKQVEGKTVFSSTTLSDETPDRVGGTS